MSQQIELACGYADRGAFDTAVEICGGVDPSRMEHAAALSLIASIYRQVGRHDVAAGFDDVGTAASDPLGRSMCRLGRVADHVGAGEAGLAAEALAAADAAIAEVKPWHWATRWFDPWLTRAWVAAEVELLGARPDAAVAALEPFAAVKPRATRNTRWPHERAKTLLFLAVARRECGDTGRARDDVLRAVEISARARLAPLLLASLPVLGDLDPDAAAGYRPEGAVALRLVERHAPPRP